MKFPTLFVITFSFAAYVLPCVSMVVTDSKHSTSEAVADEKDLSVPILDVSLNNDEALTGEEMDEHAVLPKLVHGIRGGFIEDVQGGYDAKYCWHPYLRAQKVYNGCGYTYRTYTAWKKQCGGGGHTTRFIPDGGDCYQSFGWIMCCFDRAKTVYTGCGYTYLIYEQGKAQCGPGLTATRFIPDEEG